MFRVVLLVALAAACGRLGFEPVPDTCAGEGDCDGLLVSATKDASTLLISSFQGEVFAFDASP